MRSVKTTGSMIKAFSYLEEIKKIPSYFVKTLNANLSALRARKRVADGRSCWLTLKE